MLNIQRLIAKDFLCYKELSINFAKDTVTQIIGANGSGKSSIPTALEEAFYSKNSKGLKKDELPRWGTKGYELEVYFDFNSAPYHLIVKRASSLRVTLYEDGQDISGHTSTQTYKILHETIGLDFNTFTKLVYQNLNSSLEFLTATDTKRKEFLVGLFDLSEYLETEKLLKSRNKDTKVRHGSVSSSLDSVSRVLNRQIIEPGELVEVPETIDNSERIYELESQIKDSEQHNKWALRSKTANELYLNLKENPVENNLAPIDQKEIKDLDYVCADNRARLRQLDQTIKEYSGLRDTCHACGTSLDISDQLKLKAEAEKERNTLSTISNQKFSELELLKNLDLQYKKAESARLLYETKLKEAEAGYDPEANTEFINVENAKNELVVLKQEQELNGKSIASAIQHNQGVEAARQAAEKVRESQVSAIEEQKSLAEQEAELALELEDQKLLIQAFGTKGLLNHKIENMIKELEETINHYLVHVSDGKFLLEFVTEGPKLNVSISHLGRAVTVNSLSSGELQKVNIATLLAVRKLMSAFSKSHINLLFFDEVVSTLDAEARELLIEILQREHGLNSFVVSHGWSHPLVAKITIKEGKAEYGQ